MKKWIHQLALKPSIIFLMDGAGAFLTATLIFCVLRPFNEFIGVPMKTLSYLSVMALVISIYSVVAGLFSAKHWKPLLTGTIIFNVLYCASTVGVLVYYYPSVTALGYAYFLLEVVIILGLAYIEYLTLTASPTENRQ